jgi:hypothetical protein
MTGEGDVQPRLGRQPDLGRLATNRNAKLLTQKCIPKITLQSYIPLKSGFEAGWKSNGAICHKTALMFPVFDTVL